MTLLAALGALEGLGAPVFRTADAAAAWDVSNASASQRLRRLAAAGRVISLKHATWALPGRVERFALPEALVAPFPAYVSLQSALHHYGMIEQIPGVVYAVSTARTRRYPGAAATASIHHVDPGFFFGFKPSPTGAFHIAEPEKALLDVLYLSPAKSRLFGSLPELEFSRSFSFAKAERYARRIGAARRRSHVLGALRDLRAGAAG